MSDPNDNRPGDLRAALQRAQEELAFYKQREADICKAVGSVSDGGRYRNDIIEHLQGLVKMQAERDEALLNLKQIHEQEFLRRAEAMVTESGTDANLTVLGRMVLRRKAQHDRLGNLLRYYAPFISMLARFPYVSAETRTEMLDLEDEMISAVEEFVKGTPP